VDTDSTGELGVTITRTVVLKKLKWVFRRQHESDEGIDAQVETKVDGKTTGRLLALQIKGGSSGGSSYFREKKPDGWVFRFNDRLARLWLGHALPVVVVLVDVESETAYWQRIDESTVSTTRKGYKVLVPEANTVDLAGDQWQHMASGLEGRAIARYEIAVECIPPAARSLIEKMRKSSPHGAAVLALHLADGRGNPRGTVHALLTAAPHWIEEDDARGWLALAAYAIEHELAAENAVALEKAADALPARRGKLLAAAALNVMRVDLSRSALLLDQAEKYSKAEVEAEVLVRVGRALLRHPPGDAGPRVVDPPLDLGDPSVAESAAIQSFLRDQATRDGDLDSALGFARRALELEPEDSSLMVGLAGVMIRKTFGMGADHHDVDEAVTLLRTALTQRHRWDGPTVDVLDGLLGALSLVGDFEGILEVSLPGPDGTATPEEAIRPDVVRHAIAAAHFLSKQDIVRELADRLGNSARDQLEKARVGVITLSNKDEESLWLQVLNEAVDRDEYQEIAIAALNLGKAGRDEAARLASYVDRHIIPQGTADLVSALAAAKQDLDGALPTLRDLARHEIGAAEHLIGLLAAADRYTEAVAAAEDAHEAFRQPYFLMLEADLFLDAKDWDAAEQSALRAVAATDSFPRQRARLLTYLGGRAADRGDWSVAEEYLGNVLPLHAVTRSSDVWRLVAAQLHNGAAKRAAATIQKHRPRVTSLNDAHLWIQSMVSAPWDESIASQALSLAIRFEADAELSVALLGQIILRTTTDGPLEASEDSDSDSSKDREDLRPHVPSELHRRAFAALEKHINTHGDLAGFQRFQGTDEELLAQMAEQLKQEYNEPLRELLEQVQQGRFPIGIAATARGRSYALTLVQQSTGPLVAAAADDSEHDEEKVAALTSLNGQVVVDASSLLLTSQLTGGGTISGHFRRLLLPAAARRDILRAVVEVQGLAGSPGTLGWDAKAQKLAFYELTATNYLRYSARAEALEGAADTTTVREVADLSLFETVNSRDGDQCWLAPIQLANDEGLSLWADDIGLRRLARSVGVKAFGTPALVEALNDRALETCDVSDTERLDSLLNERAAWVSQFVREWVVDVPAHLIEVRAQAVADDWHPQAAAAILSRPSWWAWQHEPFNDWRVIAREVNTNRPEAFGEWQYAAMLGVSRAYVDPNYAAAMLASLALLGAGGGGSAEDAAEGCARAGDVATSRGIPDPLIHVPAIAGAMGRLGWIEDAEQFAQDVLSLYEANVNQGD
jgi:hypothetical protein